MTSLFTIGVYGWDEGVFFARLRSMPIDLLIDVRQRRGVRGRAYRFGNISRLEPSLRSAGIDYEHHRNLAPTSVTRALQADEDARTGTAKRQRTAISPAFAEAYAKQISDSGAFDDLREVLESGTTPVLLCVEREPAACHRSILADLLQSEGVAEVHHLLP